MDNCIKNITDIPSHFIEEAINILKNDPDKFVHIKLMNDDSVVFVVGIDDGIPYIERFSKE
jgi:hypothetical protein